MPTATPDTIGDVLGQLVQEAARQAAAQPAKLQEVFEQAGRSIADVVEQAEQLPADALQKLKDIVEHPDWWSLLVFVLVTLSELDPAHLSVGSMHPAGWSRTVTLTYTEAPGRTITAGLALTDPDTIHGFVLKADAAIDTGAIALGPLALSITSDGAVDWRIGFSGPLTPPAQQAQIDAALSWDPKIAVGDDTAGFKLGALRTQIRLSTRAGAPLYTITFALGDAAGTPGAQAKVDLSQVLGVLAAIVHIQAIDESYSPALVLAAGSDPQFTLGQRSLA